MARSYDMIDNLDMPLPYEFAYNLSISKTCRCMSLQYVDISDVLAKLRTILF